MNPRKITRRILLAGLLLSVSGAMSFATTFSIGSGKRLLLNGQPFTIQGVNYSPTPVGYKIGGFGTNCIGPYHWWMDRPTYIADFPQIHRLGANTIRTFDLMNSTASVTQVRQALDAAYANGLYVIMGFFMDQTVDLSQLSVRTQALNQFAAAVQSYKDHPAVMMWAFGNENNLNNGNTNANWYSLVEQAAQQAKAIDPSHLVTTVEGECFGSDCFPSLPAGQSFSFEHTVGNAAIGSDDATMSFLDLWGVNVYRGTSFGTAFQVLAASTTKPILVTEFGKDAYRDSVGGEDQAMQASYISSQWQQITSNLSATSSGIANLIGGVVFEWTDEWWKDSGDDCITHGTQVIFHRTNDLIDPNYQDEWFGITSVLPRDPITNPNGTSRTFRKSFATLQGFWNANGATVATAAGSQFFSDTVRNYPNPFQVGTAPTKFVALVNEAGTINIRIYDASGQFVTGLPPVSATAAGRYELQWDGKNHQGSYVSSGLYFARIEGHSATHNEKQFRRVVAVK